MALGLAVITGHSMIPTYVPGERVLVKYGSTFRVNDVVLVEFQDRIDIKRVAKIVGSQVFIEGDNSQVSIDSRQNGPVMFDRVIGKVIYRLPRWLSVD